MKPLSIIEFQKELPNALILDLRNKNIFENGFIPNSINIGIDGAFKDILNLIVEKDRKIILVCSDKIENECATLLAKQGFINIIGWLEGGFENWQQSSKKIDMMIMIQADELATDIYFLNEHEILIDTREFDERKLDFIENSIHIPLEDISDKIAELDRTKSYYIIGIDGYSSVAASSFLKSNGFDSVKCIDATYSEIQEALKYHKKS
ncbi:MAG: hypothetical protein J5I91_06730 [Bacteroidetes bacterium]|nr:hypothetical protein [Bacteroidota bacterium]